MLNRSFRALRGLLRRGRPNRAAARKRTPRRSRISGAVEELEPRLCLSASAVSEELAGLLAGDDPSAGSHSPAEVATAAEARSPDGGPDDDAGPGLTIDPTAYSAGSVLVQLKPGATIDDLSGLLADERLTARPYSLPGLMEVELSGSIGVEESLRRFRNDPAVLVAEPDYRIQLESGPPNDPLFDMLWGLDNTGQDGGIPDADIDGPEAWSVTTGSPGTVIAVIDTGVDYAHPDLVENIWVNADEIAGNGVDDDGNGFVDDHRGYDFYNNDADPMDDNGHGTHVAGTIAAAADNGIGVAGVAPDARIMPLKFLSGEGSGFTSDAVRALDYAVTNGATVSNNSWGSTGFSQSLFDAVGRARDAGHVFVAAAGNASNDNDASGFYPASFSLDNVVSVAATDRNDELASFSNYGSSTVDLGAPGVDIVSTFPGDRYARGSGTSMAAPHVSGAVALVQSMHPDWSYDQVIDRVLATTDPVTSLRNRTLTGGRLNAAAAVTDPEPGGDDHGNVPGEATMVAADGWTRGHIGDDGDEDWFSFRADANAMYAFQGRLGTLSGATLVLRNESGGDELKLNTASGGTRSPQWEINWTAPGDGLFFWQITGSQQSSRGSYWLMVEETSSPSSSALETESPSASDSAGLRAASKSDGHLPDGPSEAPRWMGTDAAIGAGFPLLAEARSPGSSIDATTSGSTAGSSAGHGFSRQPGLLAGTITPIGVSAPADARSTAEATDAEADGSTGTSNAVAALADPDDDGSPLADGEPDDGLSGPVRPGRLLLDDLLAGQLRRDRGQAARLALLDR